MSSLPVFRVGNVFFYTLISFFSHNYKTLYSFELECAMSCFHITRVTRIARNNYYKFAETNIN